MTHLCSGILARRRRTGGASHCWRSCRTPRSCRSTAPSMPAGSASACTLRAAAPAAGRVLLFDTFIHNFTGVFRVCTTGLASGSRAWTSDCRAISKCPWRNRHASWTQRGAEPSRCPADRYVNARSREMRPETFCQPSSM